MEVTADARVKGCMVRLAMHLTAVLMTLPEREEVEEGEKERATVAARQRVKHERMTAERWEREAGRKVRTRGRWSRVLLSWSVCQSMRGSGASKVQLRQQRRRAGECSSLQRGLMVRLGGGKVGPKTSTRARWWG